MPQGDTHKMAEWLGVQTLGYLSADGLVSSTHGKRTSVTAPRPPRPSDNLLRHACGAVSTNPEQKPHTASVKTGVQLGDALPNGFTKEESGFCRACFTGVYPVPITGFLEQVCASVSTG